MLQRRNGNNALQPERTLRADKEVVSIRTDYEDYTGGVHGYYANFGYNIDPETGKELSLFDVVTDKDALYKNIVDYLIEYDDWEFNEERRSDLYEQFDEGLMWTIDYDKLTIYFNDIANMLGNHNFFFICFRFFLFMTVL